MFFAVQEKRGEGIDGEQPTPEKQRAFLSRPKSGKLVKKRQGVVAVLRHIRHGEIVGEEEVFERCHCQRDKAKNRHAGIPGALGERGTAGDNADYSGYEGIHRGQKRKQQ